MGMRNQPLLLIMPLSFLVSSQSRVGSTSSPPSIRQCKPKPGRTPGNERQGIHWTKDNTPIQLQGRVPCQRNWIAAQRDRKLALLRNLRALALPFFIQYYAKAMNQHIPIPPLLLLSPNLTACRLTSIVHWLTDLPSPHHYPMTPTAWPRVLWREIGMLLIVTSPRPLRRVAKNRHV